MGQYYRPVLQETEGEFRVLNRVLDGERTLAKLMEHSWWNNPFVSTVTQMLYDTPMHLAWVGDYADDVGTFIAKKMYRIAWGDGEESVDGEGITRDELTLDDKVILNHTKKLYVCCNEYKEKSRDNEGWVAHPLPLLTAIGNGQGGGDYSGVNEEFVGCWACDLLEVDDMAREGYDKFDIFWKEDC